jgi:hypothetical protein
MARSDSSLAAQFHRAVMVMLSTIRAVIEAAHLHPGIVNLVAGMG